MTSRSEVGTTTRNPKNPLSPPVILECCDLSCGRCSFFLSGLRSKCLAGFEFYSFLFRVVKIHLSNNLRTCLSLIRKERERTSMHNVKFAKPWQTRLIFANCWAIIEVHRALKCLYHGVWSCHFFQSEERQNEKPRVVEFRNSKG